MTGLRRAAEDYLAMRRTLGFKLTTQAAQLMSFIDYCEFHGSDRITSDLALEWATTTRSGSTHDGYLARRLMTVRIFARYYKTLDPGSEIPPEDALPHHRCRIAPYLYSLDEITALIEAARRLRPELRAATWQTFIGLLAVTGMRKSEACRLNDNHIASPMRPWSFWTQSSANPGDCSCTTQPSPPCGTINSVVTGSARTG